MTRVERWRRRLLVPALLLLATEALAATFGNPAGFLQKETLRETPLHPGVVWKEVQGEYDGRPMYIHVVTVDLSHPQLTLRALPGQRFVSPPNQYFRRSVVSQLQRDNTALVAINTAFFDIGATQTPFGLLIADERMLRTPATNRSVLAFTEDKEVRIGNFTATVISSYKQTAPMVSSINGNTITANQLHVYQQPWDRSPGNTAAFAGGLPLTEVVVERTGFYPATAQQSLWRQQGTVVAVRDEMGPVTIGAGQYVLTASGTVRDYLKGMQPGDEIDLLWRLAGGPAGLSPYKVDTVLAGSSLLLVDGNLRSVNSDHWNTRHPRSAVGVAPDRKRIMLVLVEGRLTGKAEGMSLHTVAAYLKHMGALDGLEFDGGGSSALAGRVVGQNRLLSQPSDGSERYVPVGLGIHLIEEADNPFFIGVRSSGSDREAVVSWQTQAPAVSYAVQVWPDPQPPAAYPAEPALQHSAPITGTPPAAEGWLVRLFADHPGGSEQSPLISIPRGPAHAGTGVPGWWLTHFFGGNPPLPGSDPDGDGAGVAEEYYWGTDPLNPLSKPHLRLDLAAPGTYRLSFGPYLAGRSYRLYSLGGAQPDSWTENTGVSPGATPDGLGEFTLPLPDHGILHQLRVSLPE